MNAVAPSSAPAGVNATEEDLVLEELVDRDALVELVASFRALFGVPLRIYSGSGLLLADCSEQPAIYEYLNQLRRGRAALQEVVAGVKAMETGVDGEASYACFTGAAYHAASISYEGRCLGRMVLGPFLPPSVTEVPRSLVAVDPDVDLPRAKHLLARMPRVKAETVREIANHLRRSLDLILFSGHKALLTSRMHLASVRESFRDLQDQNEQLKDAYQRLKELDRLKSNFLATVSHELRTPLTSIIGYSEMLIEGIAGEMSQDQREFVTTIHEKGEQLLELITGLLDLSKLESGTLSMRKCEIAVGDVIKDVIETLSPAARKRGVSLTLRLEDGLPRLWADPTRLRQILLNLVDNALKFTTEGGTIIVSAATTRMELERTGDEDDGGLVLLGGSRPAVEFRVADTGAGISDADKERVFDAFYQVDSSSTRQVGGTGLGLSIVRRLVEGHEGQVRIEDNDPKGSVFVVTIPCRKGTLS